MTSVTGTDYRDVSERWVSIRSSLIGYTFQAMSQNTPVADPETPISKMRERLTGMMADWGTDFSALLRELEEKRALLQEIEAEAARRSHEVDAVQRKVEAQDTLIEKLKTDAKEAVTLRKAVHEKDLEIEKKRSEIHSKHELIDALRRDVQGIGRLKGAIKSKDIEIARLAKEKRHAQKHAAELTEEFKILTASTLTGIDAAAELEAVRAELDARKTLIESLRGDAARAQVLETQLEEKRDVISRLEASIDRHVGSLAESQQSVATWKEKYASLKARNPSPESTIAREPTEEELQAQESAEDISEDLTSETAPHDMSESLLET